MRPPTPGPAATFDGAVADLLVGSSALAAQAGTPEARAAAKALQAATTLLLCALRPSPIVGAREAALVDLGAALAVLRGDDVGRDELPARYDMDGRETLDRMRDLLGPNGYAAGCMFNVIKYLDRRGKKGDAALDDEKALFYLQAAGEALFGLPDPRAHRPTFTPYVEQRSAWPSRLYDLLDRLEGVKPGRGRDVFENVLTALYGWNP